MSSTVSNSAYVQVEKRAAEKKRPKYPRVVNGPLRFLLFCIFALFAIVGANSLYLVSITFLEWVNGVVYQNYFYQFMFIAHLVGGLLIVVPTIIFGVVHMRRAMSRPNHRAKAVGYGLFGTAIALFLTGFLLMRLEIGGREFFLREPISRIIIYWLHITAPLVAIWLFVLHRLAGRRIKWWIGALWFTVAGTAITAIVFLQSQDPRTWEIVGPESGLQYFEPSQARTATGNFIPTKSLMNDDFCLECHADIHEKWSVSAHRFSSFNNPAYAFSVLNTREKMYEREGTVKPARFCAGCHDPVMFFGGAFDDPKYDDPNYDFASDELAQAGITCTVCHAITTLNNGDTTIGNADFTIGEPMHYPFTFSENPKLRWLNRQMIKAKPALHKATFLKPLHKSPEFCGSCHKVHLPEELNDYKWVRGQNHYDSHYLSGVSGQGLTSFYYPPQAEQNCNNCHMPLQESEDFGAQRRQRGGPLTVHDHQFPSANTAIPHLLDMPEWVNAAHEKFLEGVMRIDLFGIRTGKDLLYPLVAPLRPEVPTLRPGEEYLIETVIRTLKMGHHFTQGTVDSNEIWVELTATSNGEVIGMSGGRGNDGTVDPWSYFVNAYVVDREGKRIDQRNAEDIFIAVYNHQIPPGAADTVHYKLRVPADCGPTITVQARLLYRKFDTTFLKHFQGDEFVSNDLPIITLATDEVTFSVGDDDRKVANATPDFPLWQRWNDYGISMLRQGLTSEAIDAFGQVAALGKADGALNQARAYIVEGDLDQASAALQRAARFVPPPPPWSMLYFTGLVNKQTGQLDEALRNFQTIRTMSTDVTESRGYRFWRNYQLSALIGETHYELSNVAERQGDLEGRQKHLSQARRFYEDVLERDPENADAHYNLMGIYTRLSGGGGAAGDSDATSVSDDAAVATSRPSLDEMPNPTTAPVTGNANETGYVSFYERKARDHAAAYEKYRVDDNAGEVINEVLQDPARPEVRHAAGTTTGGAIYDLQRPEAFGLSKQSSEESRVE